MVRVVGIGDYAVSRDTQDILMTFSLSSCVALTAYDPVNKVLGMAHIVLPGRGSNVCADINPAYYVDTAIPLLIKKCVIFATQLKTTSK